MATKAALLAQRARRVFPGNKWTRAPLSEAWLLDDPQGRFPTFLTSGSGCRVTDVDGRTFIDYHCAFGANVLGYNDERVEAAAAMAAKHTGGQLLSGPTSYSVELAERLIALRPGSTWAMFAKNGSDVTTMARVAARAATGGRYVLREASALGARAYHGAAPQWLHGKPGVTDGESAALELTFLYNDLESVEEAVAHAAADGGVAAIFVGGCSYPYSAPTVEPTPAFIRGLRAIADRAGALLVLDEIRTAFRVGRGVAPGSWVEAGGGGGSGGATWAPDLHCICKAVANGHPIAALVGNDAARDGAGAMMSTGTYWLGAPSMAAALATLDALEAEGSAAMASMQARGTRLARGLEARARAHGVPALVSGPPAMPFLTFEGEAPHARPLGERWCAEMAARGVWLHPHHNWYLCASHTDDDVDATLVAAEGAFDALAAGGVGGAPGAR